MEAKPVNIIRAKKKAEEILGAIHYDTTSLTHALVSGFRAGMSREKGLEIYTMISSALQESQKAFEIAVNQPEQKAAVRPVVDL